MSASPDGSPPDPAPDPAGGGKSPPPPPPPPVEFTGGTEEFASDDLRNELRAVFAAVAPGRRVEAITVSRSFTGYSADLTRRAVFGVEVRFADGFETHIVKLGTAAEVRPDYDGWHACTAGRQVASRIFAPVRLVDALPIPGRSAVLYQDAYTLFGRTAANDRPESLEQVARWAVRDASPDPLSVERAVAHIYTDLGRWFYRTPAANAEQAAGFYRARLGVGAGEAGKRVLDRWQDDGRVTLRRDAVWVLCVRDRPEADHFAAARYLDPVEYVRWALDDPARLPETLVGPAHGDLHARNVLLGVRRGEAEYPAVFDYGEMRPTNVLAWDFAKLEGELTRVLLPPLLDDPAVLDRLAGESGLRPKASGGSPTPAGQRADRLRAFLRFHELLDAQTVPITERAQAELLRPPPAPPPAPPRLARLLAVLLRIRKEAAIALGFDRPGRQGRWRDEYLFAAAVVGLLNAKTSWDYSEQERECALVGAGAAVARMGSVPGVLAAGAAAGAADGPFPSYRVPLAVAHALWTGKRFAAAAAFAERVVIEPPTGPLLVIRPAARHAVPLIAEAMLAVLERGEAVRPVEHLLDRDLRPLARQFGDYETLARLGKLFKETGDRRWEESGLPFAQFRRTPGWQMYLKAKGVYAEAYAATGDY